MVPHNLSVHAGAHIAGTFSDRVRFAEQFTQHLNVLLDQTGRRFDLTSVDQSPIPLPENPPDVLSDQHDVHLYMFDQRPNPSRNGSWTVGGDGSSILVIPAASFQIAGDQSFDLNAYSTLLSTAAHERFHSLGGLGEGYSTNHANPPADVPMPSVNIWHHPQDVYWNASRRNMIADPFWTRTIIGHPLFDGEPQTLDWLLATMRPCPGNAALMAGDWRKGSPWPRVFLVRATQASLGLPRVRVRAWSVPADYEQPWVSAGDAETDVMGYVALRWSDLEHGSPLMAIRCDLNGFEPCAGYVSIFELGWQTIAGMTRPMPVLNADMLTSQLTLPALNLPDAPPPIPPPRQTIRLATTTPGVVRIRGCNAGQQIEIFYGRIGGAIEHQAFIEAESSDFIWTDPLPADPESRMYRVRTVVGESAWPAEDLERFAPACDFCNTSGGVGSINI